MDVHGAFRHEGRILPDAVYQVLAAEDAGGIGGERRKEVEFGARQRNGMGADDYLFGVEIYRDVAEDEPAFALSGAGRLSCTAFETALTRATTSLMEKGLGM